MTDYRKFFKEVMEEHEQIDISNINGNVLIVDALNTYIRCFAAVPTMNEDGEHVGGMSGFLKSVGKAIRTFKPTRCIIAFDGKGGSQRRRKLYPDYKENRRSMTRLNRTYDFKDKKDEQVALHQQLIVLAHMLKCLPVTVLAPQNVEADDVIAYLAHTIKERGGKSIIVSTDKDFLQIVNENIDVYNPIKKRVYHVDTIVEEYGIHPNNFAIFRALDGDKSDNIPGVKGVGLKSLLKHYPHLVQSDRATVDSILDFASSQEKGKLFENIRNNRKIIERNFKLMRLDEVMISGTTKMDIINRIDSADIVMDKNGLTRILVDHKMLGSFGNYDQWLVTTWQPLTRFALE